MLPPIVSAAVKSVQVVLIWLSLRKPFFLLFELWASMQFSNASVCLCLQAPYGLSLIKLPNPSATLILILMFP